MKSIPCRLVTFVFALAAFSNGASAQNQDFSKVEEKVTDLGHGVYWILGAGGNTTVAVGSDGIILVDDQFAPVADKLKAAVATLSKAPIKFVINTHFHGDHSAGRNSGIALSGDVHAMGTATGLWRRWHASRRLGCDL